MKVQLDDGETEILASNLDENEAGNGEFKALYFFRWKAETDISVLMKELQIESFSGNRTVCVLQDFQARVIAYNIEAIIMYYAKRRPLEKRKDDNKEANRSIIVNRNIGVSLLRDHLLRFFCREEDIGQLLSIIVIDMAHNIEPVIEGRNYSRKRRRLKVYGKYITLNNYKRVI